MTKTKGFLLAVAAAAMAFTFSCSSGDDNNGGGDPSSSSGGSQGGGGSSSSGGGGNACTADFGEITIGSQVWAKKNLDCDYGNSKCYDNNSANCETYGRLYDWETAKTACPSGWHLPSQAEWDILENNAGGHDAGGKKLKASSGWLAGAETDEYGFSALPGGAEYYDGSPLGPDGAGFSGFWWSATESGFEDYIVVRYIKYYIDSFGDDTTRKMYFLSVRCLKNED